MSMGLFDLPAPLFDAIDALLAAVWLPPALRVILYAIGCGWISMALYGRYSDQAQLRAVRVEIARAQAALATHEGDFAELNRLVRQNLRLTLRQLGLTLRPALIASLPLLFVLPWLSNAFGLAPAATPLRVCVEPAQAAADLHWDPPAKTAAAGCWDVNLPDQSHATLEDAHGAPIAFVPGRPQSAFVHKFIWLNWLIGNPDGYLPQAAPFRRLTLERAPRDLLPFGPEWLRGWEALFFLVLLAVSLLLKRRWRVI